MRIVSRFLSLLLLLAACKASDAPKNLAFTVKCDVDSDCASGRCLDGLGDVKFCSQECGADAECASTDTLYCCESLGEKNYCVRPTEAECRKPVLADACAGPNDPYCARASLTCEQVGGRLTCTQECVSDDDCVNDLAIMQCQQVDTRKLCVPVDPATLPRITSNCLGDRDCPAGQVCNIDFDNRLDPQTIVTVCSSEQIWGPQKAYTSCNVNRDQCDRFFCVDNFCPATCANDSHCKPGFSCRPQPLQTTDTSFVLIGLCAKMNGSEIPCDKQSPLFGASGAVCPSGEACSYKQRFDGALETVCLANAKAASTASPVSMSYARLNDACSPLEDKDGDPSTAPIYKLVGNQVKLCDNDLCLSAGYCSAPCLDDNDCGGANLSCMHFDFQPHCERPEREGAANGQPCAGPNADALCASLFCNGGNCAARKAPGEPCSAANECLSFECVSNVCKKMCRDDASCGGSGFVCQANPRLADVFGTASTADDLIDTPTFCEAASGASGIACPGPSGCPGDQTCRTVLSGDGSARGVCADKNAGGLTTGATCTQNAACASNYCLILGSQTSGVCSELCSDDTSCTGGTRCVPVTALGTSIDLMCGKSPGAVADGAACTKFSDCASFLCVEGTCRSLCPAATGCTSGTCAPVALSIDARFTPELFDDRYDSVLACVEGAAPFAGDPTTCASPRQFVFRNINGTLQGACLTPIADAKARGAECRSASECRTGLCVDNKCSEACTNTPTNSCSVGTCDLAAPALLGESPTFTTAVAACR